MFTISIFKELIDIINGAMATFDSLFGEKERIPCVAAVRAIQTAANQTRTFIKAEGYVTNDNLSDLWLQAMEKATIAKLDNQLSFYLLQKSKFWNDPQLWIENPDTMSLIPTLNQLDQECEMALLKLS
jgi:hypothetical protein